MDRHYRNAQRARLVVPERATIVPAGLATLGAATAAAAWLSPPRKEEAPGWRAGVFRDQDKTHTPDCAYHPVEDQAGAADAKRFATLRARLALAGWTLTRDASGVEVYTASRWDRATDGLHGLDSVEAFASRVGAPL